MKIKTIFEAILATAILACASVSCDSNEDEATVGNGTVSGYVRDAYDNGVDGVTVSVKDTELSTQTASDGSYTLENVPMKTSILTFSKKGYQTASITVSASRYADAKVTVNATLSIANAKISGTVYDGANGDVPFKGVTVTMGDKTAVTDASGAFLFDDLTATDYTLTFAADEYVTVTKKVAAEEFNNEDVTAVLSVTLYKSQILPGKTLTDLQNADKWFYSEYRGGSNGQEYPRWDWSVDFMGTFNFYGEWQEIGEGTDIMYSESNDDPVDLENFCSYTYGSKLITNDNYIMTVRFRTFADRDAATTWGVQVVDLSAAEPEAVLLGEALSSDNTDYADAHFDLSQYIGKEVVLAIGVYKSEDGKQKHLAIRRINFTAEEMSGWGWIKGTDIAGLEDWHLTAEMVRSTMPQTVKEFSGVTTSTSDSRADKYQSWRTNNHIGWLWSFMALTKDTEIFAGQGALIKTRGGSSYVINTLVPEAYFYTKFAVAEGSNQLTFRVRNFSSSNATFFKVTAVTEDLAVSHLSPVSNTAQSASAAEDGCWKYIHNQGESDSPNDYAAFTYDLSSYNGQNVVIAIGVFKGEANSDENKLVIHSVSLN